MKPGRVRSESPVFLRIGSCQEAWSKCRLGISAPSGNYSGFPHLATASRICRTLAFSALPLLNSLASMMALLPETRSLVPSDPERAIKLTGICRRLMQQAMNAAAVGPTLVQGPWRCQLLFSCFFSGHRRAPHRSAPSPSVLACVHPTANRAASNLTSQPPETLRRVLLPPHVVVTHTDSIIRLVSLCATP